MKKLSVMLSSITMLLMMSMICSCQTRSASPVELKEETKEELKEVPKEEPKVVIEAPVVGTLTAYYAKENFSAGGINYKKGQLICDTNDPINKIVEQDDQNYKYEGDDTGEYYSWLLPKSIVEKKTFLMNQLSAENVGEKAVFLSEKGCVARVFWSTINGHKYYDYEGKEEKWRETERLSECYVLSVEYISIWDGEKYMFEEQLEEKQGNIKIYAENHYRDAEGQIGFVEERWYNKEDWPYSKSAYGEDGKLLVDQWECADIPEYISIAYIGDIDALYVDGVLYFRK